jgi:hypothetical protein
MLHRRELKISCTPRPARPVQRVVRPSWPHHTRFAWTEPRGKRRCRTSKRRSSDLVSGAASCGSRGIHRSTRKRPSAWSLGFGDRNRDKQWWTVTPLIQRTNRDGTAAYWRRRRDALFGVRGDRHSAPGGDEIPPNSADICKSKRRGPRTRRGQHAMLVFQSSIPDRLPGIQSL